jgi:hypothetical protein
VSDALLDLAHQAETELDRLIALPGFDHDYDLGRVARSLGLWSISIARLAESGPASLRSTERRFRGHPEFGQADPDPMASHRALLDVVGFLSVGDMLLDDWAALQLARWSLGTGDIPWRTLTKRIDSGDLRGKGLRYPIRYLDLVLREARARIVAHRRRRHVLSNTWTTNGAYQVNMLGMDERGFAEAELAAVLAEAGAPATPGVGFFSLADSVVEVAAVLDGAQRKRVVDAFAEGGYSATDPAQIVPALLTGLTATITDARRQDPPIIARRLHGDPAIAGAGGPPIIHGGPTLRPPSTTLEPPPGFPIEDAVAAWSAHGEFWAALAKDDDVGTRELFFEPSRIRSGLPILGLAAALRGQMGVTIEMSASMGMSSTLRVLPDGAWAFLATPTDRYEVFTDPSAVHAWVSLMVQNAEGRWQVWGSRPGAGGPDARFIQLPFDVLRPGSP